MLWVAGDRLRATWLTTEGGDPQSQLKRYHLPIVKVKENWGEKLTGRYFDGCDNPASDLSIPMRTAMLMDK